MIFQIMEDEVDAKVEEVEAEAEAEAVMVVVNAETAEVVWVAGSVEDVATISIINSTIKSEMTTMCTTLNMTKRKWDF